MSGLQFLWNLYPLNNTVWVIASACDPGLVPTLPGTSFPQQFNEGAGDDSLQGPLLPLPLTLKAAFGQVEIDAAQSKDVNRTGCREPLPPVPLIINSSISKRWGHPPPRAAVGGQLPSVPGEPTERGCLALGALALKITHWSSCKTRMEGQLGPCSGQGLQPPGNHLWPETNRRL